jgi:hypothetical protein
MLKFWKRRSNFKVKGLWSRSWYKIKDLAKRNTHVKYENPSAYKSKAVIKDKGLEKKVKLQGKRSEDKCHGIKRKGLPDGIHMRNMKALASTDQKL